MGVLLDIVLFPVSAVLWFWHAVFGALFGPDTAAAWVLAIVSLVVTPRILLVRRTVEDKRGERRMEKLQPQLDEIEKTYRDDPERANEETKKLYTENNARRLTGCLQGMLQAALFITFFAVLWRFTEDPGASSLLDEESFRQAHLFGAGLGNWVSQPGSELAAAGTNRQHMLAVALPVMLLAAMTTFASWWTGRRHSRSDMPRHLVIYAAVWMHSIPVATIAVGLFLPVPLGVLVHMLVGNVWHFAEWRMIKHKIDGEERATA